MIQLALFPPCNYAATCCFLRGLKCKWGASAPLNTLSVKFPPRTSRPAQLDSALIRNRPAARSQSQATSGMETQTGVKPRLHAQQGAGGRSGGSKHLFHVLLFSACVTRFPLYSCLLSFVQAHYSTWPPKSSTRVLEDMGNRRTFGLWAAPS